MLCNIYIDTYNYYAILLCYCVYFTLFYKLNVCFKVFELFEKNVFFNNFIYRLVILVKIQWTLNFLSDRIFMLKITTMMPSSGTVRRSEIWK